MPAETLDSAPTFDLGTGGQNLVYSNIVGTRDTGHDINPARELVGLSISNSPNFVLNMIGGDLDVKGLSITNSSSSVLNLNGGDLNLNGPLQLGGVINTGSNRFFHQSGTVTRTGFPAYVSGKMVRRFTAQGEDYSFSVGDVVYAPVKVTATTLASGPADITVTALRGILPGLDPPISVSFRWDLEQTGSMISRLELTYPTGNASGNQGLYRAWRSSGGTPTIVFSTVSTQTDTVTAPGLSSITGSWGISERPPLISISGAVMASNGVGIRNAVVKISGGNLSAPVSFITAPFGTYQFTNLDPSGEYTITVSAKRNRFATPSQTVSSLTNITNLNFVANPIE